MSAKKTAKKHRRSESDDLKKHYMLGLPLLTLMGLVAVAGIVATIALRYFFKLG